MPMIGVRELRERTTEVLRRVQQEGMEYVITRQGKPVALLLPVQEAALEAALVQASKRAVGGEWEAYNRVARALRHAWPSTQSTQSLLDELRRD